MAENNTQVPDFSFESYGFLIYIYFHVMCAGLGMIWRKQIIIAVLTTLRFAKLAFIQFWISDTNPPIKARQ